MLNKTIRKNVLVPSVIAAIGLMALPSSGFAAISSSHIFKHITVNVEDYSAYVYVNRGRLNVRSSPGGRVVTSVGKGTHVRVLAHRGDWRQIYFNNRVQGWSHKNYLVSKSVVEAINSRVRKHAREAFSTTARKQ